MRGADPIEKYFEEIDGGARVRCTLTGHEMPNAKAAIEKFSR